MAISKTAKQDLIQQLLATKTKSYQTEIKLLLKRKPDEAEEVKEHGKALSRKIDELIAQSISDWLGNSNTLIKNVKTINTKLQRSIRDIENDIKIAQNVVKIVGYIDEVTEIVRGLT